MAKNRLFPLVLVFLFLSALSFSYQFGPARYLIEKTWSFKQYDSGDIGEIWFSGFLIANNSYQHITIIDHTRGMVFQQRDDGLVLALYNGTMGKTGEIKASAYVDVYYDEPKIIQDSSFQFKQLSATDLTYADAEMVSAAKSVSEQNSILTTITALTDLTYHRLEYDGSYLGKILTAEQAYAQRKGVCAEYSHLFLALAKSIGLETKYVLGYSIGNDSSWKDHSWALVKLPGYGWVPVDPTYDQAGRIDSTHVLTILSNDNNDAVEYASFYGNVKWSSSIKPKTLYAKNLEVQPVKGKCIFSETDYTVSVDLENPSNNFVIFPYLFNVNKDYGVASSSLKLLKPGEKISIKNSLNQNAFIDGYKYSVPVFVGVYENDICNGLVVSVDKTASGSSSSANSNNNSGGFELPKCISSFALVFIPLAYSLYGSRK